MFADSLMVYSAAKERMTFDIASMSSYASSLAESSRLALYVGTA